MTRYRIVYRGCAWANCYSLQRKYKWWPFWFYVDCFPTVDACRQEAYKLCEVKYP